MPMEYNDWFEAHAKKHAAIIQKLQAQGLDEFDIVQYFIFENMVEKTLNLSKNSLRSSGFEFKPPVKFIGTTKNSEITACPILFAT